MYSILIIEDDPSYRDMMEVILHMEGFEVSCTDNGAAGLAAMHQKRPDMILCDIMMPGIDGHVVLETLKGESALAEIPFIFVTAKAERADLRCGMSAGADDYLSKPFTAEELLAAVTGRINRGDRLKSLYLGPENQKGPSCLLQKITNREREVLLLVGQGQTSKKIALQLGVSLKTVEAHRANLMKKLEASNAVSLARWAFKAELL